MNPGYVSYVWMTCFVILIVSGWRIDLIGHVNRWMVTLFVGLWFVLMPFSWQVTSHLTLHLSLILIIALVVAQLRGLISSRRQFMQLLLFGLLLSIWHGYMVYSQRWSPVYLIHPVLDVAIGEAILVGGFIKNPLHQITVVSWGVMAGSLLDQLWSDPTHLQIGHAASWDQLFIAIFLTRAVALLAQWTRNKLYS
ncbi:MAG: hypothetical protein WD424_08575 [Paenibacillaceae bacterium]